MSGIARRASFRYRKLEDVSSRKPKTFELCTCGWIEKFKLCRFLNALSNSFAKGRCSNHTSGLRFEERCKRYGTCAVICSGGDLQGSGFGKEIDAHDMVVRMNGHITVGFEGDVGTKTTFT